VRRRVLLVGYRDAYGLDLFGPAEVFSEAVLRLGTPVYEVVMSAIGGVCHDADHPGSRSPPPTSPASARSQTTS
jgi:hypothetical protein